MVFNIINRVNILVEKKNLKNNKFEIKNYEILFKQIILNTNF